MEKSSKLEVTQSEDISGKDAESNVNQHHVKTDEVLSWNRSLQKYPKAIAWCCYFLFTCIMWGYDGLSGSIVISIPRWRQDYGYLYEGQYVVSAAWQLGFTGASFIGIVLGGLATGVATKYVSQKTCIAGAYVLTTAGVFAQWYSPGKMPLFFAGKLLTGLPLGIFLTIAPNYAVENAPPALRGAMVAAVNWSIVIGQLLAYGVMREVQAIQGANAYRIMYAVQWGFAGVGLAVLPFVPESPTRLLARGKLEAAKKSLARLYPSSEVEPRVVHIQTVLAENAGQAAQGGSFRECFDAKNRLRTLISCSVFFIQASSGVAWVLGYMGYFMQLSGMENQKVFDTTVGIVGLMAVGNIVSWVLVEKLGRRNTVFYGLLFCTVSLLLIGVLSLFVSKSSSVVLAQVAFMAIWAFCYQASIGAAGYAIVSEVPTSSLRAVTQSLATMTNGVSNAIWSFALPYMINPDQGNLGGKVAFIFFALLVLSDVFVFFYYPETKGRSFEEIDELFARGVSPRHFAKTKLN